MTTCVEPRRIVVMMPARQQIRASIRHDDEPGRRDRRGVFRIGVLLRDGALRQRRSRYDRIDVPTLDERRETRRHRDRTGCFARADRRAVAALRTNARARPRELSQVSSPP
jgi:hypothetical protein